MSVTDIAPGTRNLTGALLLTHGDGRYLGTAAGATDLRYLRQIAEAADHLGYYGGAAADRKELRGLVDRRFGDDPPDRAASSGGGARPRLSRRECRRAHDVDPRIRPAGGC